MKPFWHVRPARTVAIVLFSLLGLLLGAAAVWAGISRLVAGNWPTPVDGWFDQLRSASWSSPVWIGFGVVLAVLAVLMLLSAILPGRRSTLPLAGDDAAAGREEVLAGSGLAALVRSAAERTDGVSSAQVSGAEKLLRVVVQTPVDATDRVRAQVTDHVQGIVDTLPLRTAPKLRVHVVRKGER